MDVKDRILLLVRGLPGSGKSTLGSLFDLYTIAADDYFDIYCDGEFDASKLKNAHEWCRNLVSHRMHNKWSRVTVANTFTQEWELQPYIDLAKEFDYTVHAVIVENRHGSKSVHNVPEDTMEKMRKRFSVKL